MHSLYGCILTPTITEEGMLPPKGPTPKMTKHSTIPKPPMMTTCQTTTTRQSIILCGVHWSRLTRYYILFNSFLLLQFAHGSNVCCFP